MEARRSSKEGRWGRTSTEADMMGEEGQSGCISRDKYAGRKRGRVRVKRRGEERGENGEEGGWEIYSGREDERGGENMGRRWKKGRKGAVVAFGWGDGGGRRRRLSRERGGNGSVLEERAKGAGCCIHRRRRVLPAFLIAAVYSFALMSSRRVFCRSLNCNNPHQTTLLSPPPAPSHRTLCALLNPIRCASHPAPASSSTSASEAASAAAIDVLS